MAAAVDSTALLRALDRLRECANLHSVMVAIFVLQRAIRAGTAAGLRGISGGVLVCMARACRVAQEDPGSDRNYRCAICGQLPGGDGSDAHHPERSAGE